MAATALLAAYSLWKFSLGGIRDEKIPVVLLAAVTVPVALYLSKAAISAAKMYK